MIIASGIFEGRGGHRLTGRFVIERRNGEIHFKTSDDFYFDGSPAPGFALSRSAAPTPGEALATRFLDLPASGALTGAQVEVRGRQAARLDDAFDPSGLRSVFLWCFLVPSLLGIGTIGSAEGTR